MTTARTLTPQGHEIDPDQLAEVCARYGVSELSVFGSVARGDAGPASDIDLLFVLEPDARLGFALFDLEAELAGIFDRPVDLLPRDSVHRLIRDAVFAEAEVLYAA
ncbi:MAG: nucleotidyltransferase family protein [Actinobacteria bacterium]|nr:nucleotidyltransferase family protein [Actinomycetota bacterium]